MDAIYRPEDREICETLLKAPREGTRNHPALPGLIVAVGQHFLGAPYEAGTLECGGEEALVANLRTFDCVTFVENAVVLAGLIRAGRTAFVDYLAALERVRYRRGRCDGYPSRLHYFTDWLHDNQRKRILRDVTREIGGVPFPTAVHRLTDRRLDHPALAHPAAFRRMRTIEGICSRRARYHIPKDDLDEAGKGIENGDILAITTDEAGLDVRHAGIAVRLRGRLHLLHASSAAGRVVLSEEPLDRYLLAHPARKGIIVGRAIEAEKERKPGRISAPASRAPGEAGGKGLKKEKE